MKRNLFTPLALLLCLFTFILAGCGGMNSTSDAAAVKDLVITDLQVGKGDEAVAGKRVKVHYTGWLYDPDTPDHRGTKFDSSLDRGQPFEFVLGQHQVIQGWDQGLVGMKVGGQRTLIIPAALAYGPRGAGRKIPPNADLVFYVELYGVK
jgi:FKBP-type peptidyl-prolyl cis-trans isomerase FkpA